jgi:hypothetical protein
MWPVIWPVPLRMTNAGGGLLNHSIENWTNHSFNDDFKSDLDFTVQRVCSTVCTFDLSK